MPHYRKNHKNHKNKNRNKNNNNNNSHNNNNKQNKNKNDETTETTDAGVGAGELHQKTGQQPTSSAVVVQLNDSGNSTKSTSTTTTINNLSETLPTTTSTNISANSPLNSEKSEIRKATAVDTVTSDSATNVEQQFATSVKVLSSPDECSSQSPREMGMVNTKTLKEEDSLSENVTIIPEKTVTTMPQGKVVIHKIVHDDYRVESPETSGQSDQINSELLDAADDSDVAIQEEIGDTDNNQNSDTIVQRTSVSPNTFRVISIETLPIDDTSDSGNKQNGSEDDSLLPLDCPPNVIATSSSSSPQEDYKLRKAQKRAALETHFLPQFISPRFLDSIKEENNDQPELIRSADENNYDDELEDDVFIDNEAISKKANAIYPKSQVNFSKKRKTTMMPAVIQEETYPCVVEAKIIEQESIEESCSTWSSGHTAESQDAEVVFINSASSSVSDLLDLDYANDVCEEQQSIIDLDTDVSELIMKNDGKVRNGYEKIAEEEVIHDAMPPATTTSANSDTEITNEPIAQEFEFIETNELTTLSLGEFVCAAASTSSTDSRSSDRHPNCNLCPEAIECGQSLVVDNSEMSRAEKYSNLTKVPVPVPSPPSPPSSVKGDSLFTASLHDRRADEIGDLHKFTALNIVDNQIQSKVENINTTTANTKPSNSNPSSPIPSTCSPFVRQGSLESQYSDISQNTTHSQCTAINQESPTCCDWTDFDVESSVSGGGRTTAASSTIDSSEADYPNANNNSQSIKKLRQICTEALACTPYGEVVLEELANVATDIGEIGAVQKLQKAAEMPYPLPALPHIEGIQVSVDERQGHPKSVTLTQVPLRAVQSPSPPPIPELPEKHETWLGVPTASDPKVLVCLSPSQRNLIGENLNGTNTDSLLDAHKKFVERRGYHEFTTSQLNAMNAETNAERQIIQTAAVMRNKRKSLTPPPVPPPPLPRKNVSNGKHIPKAAAQSFNDDAAKKQAADDEQKQINDQRLLALNPNSVQLQTHQSSNEIASRLAKTDNQQQQQQQQLKSNESQAAQGNNNIASLEDFREIKTTTSDKVIRDEKTFKESSTTTSFAKPSNNRSEKDEFTIQFPTMKGQSLHNDFIKKSFPFSDSEKKRFASSFEPMSSHVADDGHKTKRYSNVETSTYESKKRIENGRIVYDTTKSNRECFSDGENPSSVFNVSASATTDSVMSKPDGTSVNTSEINLNTAKSLKNNSTATAPAEIDRPFAFCETTSNHGSNSSSSNRKTMITAAEQKKFETFINSEEHLKNSTSAAERIGQNARGPPAIGSSNNHKSVSQFDLFKDFDELSHQLNMELETTKAVGGGMGEKSEKMSAFYDLSRLSSESKEKFEELKRQRHEHMKELEREIERSRRSRQLKTPTGDQTDLEMKSTTTKLSHKSHFIPIHLEGTTASMVKDLPFVGESKPKLRVRLEGEFSSVAPASAPVLSEKSKTHNIPIQMENNHKRTAKQPGEDQREFRRAESLYNLMENGSSKSHSGAVDDWNRYANDLGSSENISRPFQREVEICYRGRRPNIRAPRLSVSTNDISDVHNNYKQTQEYISRHSMIDENPQSTYVSTTSRRSLIPPPIPPQPTTTDWRQRRASLPKEIHEQQLKYIASKEQELQAEFERLEKERRRLLQDMNHPQVAPQHNTRDSQRITTQKLPTLSEGEVFRQQMAEEWLNKVAEREERRLQKIIKISKINEETMKSERSASERNRNGKTDIGDEFLKRVKERRSKLAMPSDSDWESGAESQPTARTADDFRNEGLEESTSVKVIEGQTETDLRQLPRHLREFAKITTTNHNQQDKMANQDNQNYEDHKEERSHEVTENSTSSSIKKSSFVKSVKVSRGVPPPTNHAEATELRQQNCGHLSSKLHVDKKKAVVQTEVAGFADCGVRRIASVSGAGELANDHHQNHHHYSHQHRHHHHNHQHSNHQSQQQNHHQQQQNQRHDTTATATATAAAAMNATSATGGNVVKRRKQTRFLLAPIRRSWSESDLLKEIDNDLVLAKGFLYANELKQSPVMFAPKFKAKAPSGTGIWTPKNQTPTASRTNLNEIEFGSSDNLKQAATAPRTTTTTTAAAAQTPPPPPPPALPFWSPQQSPILERKQFRPVHFESPTLPRRYVRQDSAPADVTAQPPWSKASSSGDRGDSSPAETNSNTVDFVQPATSIADKIRKFERSSSLSGIYRPNTVRQNPNAGPAILGPDEVIYSVKQEYMSEPESEYDRPKKMAQLGRRQYDGIGPTTNDGMPIILRSEVKEPHQHEWYKRLYQTIHKQKHGDDYVIRYKCPRGRYAYKSNGYVSEPEPNYDSDYSTVKYRTLDRRRLQSTTSATSSIQGEKRIQDETVYGTMPNPIKSRHGSYRNQPGRIEDYVTGHSSVSEKEKKEWWDEVMDIFNGWLKDNASIPRVFIDFAKEVDEFVQLDQAKLSPHYTEGNLSRALLKEQGYASDSNVVFRKKELPQRNPLSPVEQKQVYRSVQAGGEPPLYGFRKPAPEKPKDFFEAFEFIKITPTLTKITRIQNSETARASSHGDEVKNLICFPKLKRAGFDMYTTHPKKMPSFIPMNQPPLPPNRISSKIISGMKKARQNTIAPRPTSASSSRHEQCFRSTSVGRTETFNFRRKQGHLEPWMRSKSAGAVATQVTLRSKEDKNIRISRKPHTIHVCSRSPRGNFPCLSPLGQANRSPVAFGRSVSKERTFAEEKKRLENTLPLNRYTFAASTNILRDPNLKSPDEVKKAVRSYASCPIYNRSRSLPRVTSPVKNFIFSPLKRQVIDKARQKSFQASITEEILKKATAKGTAGQKEKSKSLEKKSPIAKTSSTTSLARTNSTFSVDSIGSKVSKTKKATSRGAIKSSVASPLKQPSKSEIKSKKNSKTLGQNKNSSSSIADENKTSPISVQNRARLWDAVNKEATEKHKNNLKHSRSLSPNFRKLIAAEEFEENIYDDCEEPGSDLEIGRIEDLVWHYEQRSLSEPRSKPTVAYDIARPDSPSRTLRHEFSPTREIRVPQMREIRSPSRRKIQSLRTGQKDEVNKVMRASSLTSAEDRSRRGLHLCNNLAHSATSLNTLDHHSPTCRYRNNSERFSELNKFYNTLARVGQLERATSDCKSKPIRREGELLDFDEWRKIRFHERAERELKYLVDQLKNDQKKKDLVFRPKDVEDVKWSEGNDYGLRSKDKSVEDLRENFEKKIRQEWLNEERRHDLDARKDTYKPYWRCHTVADLASSMETKYNPDECTFAVQRKPKNQISGLSKHLVSSLTKDQVHKITQQLKEIYNGNKELKKENKNRTDLSDQYVITVENHANPPAAAHKLKVRCNSSITKEDLMGPVMRRKEASKRPVKLAELNSSKVGRSELSQTDGQKSRNNPVPVVARGTNAIKNTKNCFPTIPIPPPLPSQNNQGFKELAHQGPLRVASPSKENPDESITKKIQYFEKRKYDKPTKIIYHAREDSSPDEEEVMRAVEENIRARERHPDFRHQEMSSSLTDLRDIFGERDSSRINFPLRRPPPPPDEQLKTFRDESHYQQTITDLSDKESFESIYESKSHEVPYLHRVHTGEVQKIKDKFENFVCSRVKGKKRSNFFGSNPLRKTRSDPDLSSDAALDGKGIGTVVPVNETANVSWITHKFELQSNTHAGSGRGRSRSRKMISPPPRKDRLMPHIDIISKTAALKAQMNKKSYSPSPTRSEVDRLRMKFESLSPERCSPIERYNLSASNPDISKHLTGDWIAHKYPQPRDNARSLSNPEKGPTNVYVPLRRGGYTKREQRSSSVSPPRPPKPSYQKPKITLSSILKQGVDIFADQKFDPNAHRPKARYVPDGAEAAWKKMSAVKFQDSDAAPAVPPAPPIKGVSFNNNGSRRGPDGIIPAEVQTVSPRIIPWLQTACLKINHLPSGWKRAKVFLIPRACRANRLSTYYSHFLHAKNTGKASRNTPEANYAPFKSFTRTICVQESPNRYFESDVNIHYKTPIRYEYKDAIPEEELAMRQAESMQKLYQEERRRKYLQELQDMNSRRHTDNFTPSQKSPIPLNRYDDFPIDLAPKSPNITIYPKTIARALYNFQGQTARELTFKKGDVIFIRRQIDKNWYEGEHNAMIGLLPANYVELLTKDGVRQPPRKPSEGQARAKFNFQAQSGIELSLNKGELVTLTRRVDDNWFEGKIANRKGIFPVSYVEVLTDIGADDYATTKSVIKSYNSTRPSLDTLRTNINNEFNSLTQNGHHPPNGFLRDTKLLHKTDVLHVDTSTEPVAYRALYKYRPQNSDELELHEGDIVLVLEKCDDGWFVGTSQRSGCFGTFPGNYVERV